MAIVVHGRRPSSDRRLRSRQRRRRQDRDRRLDAHSRRRQRVRLRDPRRERLRRPARRASSSWRLRPASSTWARARVDRQRRGHQRRRNGHQGRPAGRRDDRLRRSGTDDSVRWLVGEDDTAPACTGAVARHVEPALLRQPRQGVGHLRVHVLARPTAAACTPTPAFHNHAYALIVDGGTYNGQTISGIGLTKAAHIYFRAMTVYQNPATDFADHADAIEQSASDLIGVNLKDLVTGAPSGQIISAADVAQVHKAMLAVEMRNPPTQCGFQPLLAQDPPALCDGGGKATQLFHDDFDNALSAGTSATRPSLRRTSPSATGYSCPTFRTAARARASSAPIPTIGTCAPGGDESGVLHLDSPKITIPASVTDADADLRCTGWRPKAAGTAATSRSASTTDRGRLIQAADFVYNAVQHDALHGRAGQHQPARGPAGVHRHRRRLGGRNLGPLDHQPGALRASRRTRSGFASTSATTAARASSAGTSTTCWSTSAIEFSLERVREAPGRAPFFSSSGVPAARDLRRRSVICHGAIHAGVRADLRRALRGAGRGASRSRPG